LSQNPKKPLKKKTGTANPALKYSGMAMSMALTVAIGVFLGKWIDKKFGFEDPVFTLLLVVLFLGIFMVYLVKSVSQDN